jgi:geranylgeranyl diphosphate synthase type I
MRGHIPAKVLELTAKTERALDLTSLPVKSRLGPHLMPPRAPAASVSLSKKQGGPVDFDTMLKQVRREVEARLVAIFERKLVDADSLGPDVIALVDSLRDLTMRGGKRFRPALLVAAYRAVDDEAPDGVALDAGAALELLQTYLLVHDDWMDRDDVRRGGPAVHALLAHHFGSRTMGDAAALLAGDYASAMALESLASVKTAGDRVARAVQLFAQIQQDAIRGQQIDLVGRPQNIEVMHDLKTGSYTVRGPMLLGAILAGAEPATLERLVRFANPLGVAFQLRDDLLGAFGHPKQTGKPFGSDIRSGKKTAIADEALSRVGVSDRHVLTDTLGRRDATDDDIKTVVALYERCGARAAVERRLSQLVKKATAALVGGDLSKRGMSLLLGAAATLTVRER